MRRILLVMALGACGDDTSSTPPVDAPPGECLDEDGDGVTTCDGDCDDASALTAPGADELCGDGADNDCNGAIDEDCAAGVGTFVSAMTGDDANPGTAVLPVKSIGKGIANAVLLGGQRSVIVGEGSYAEKVTLVEGVDLLGGHQCNATACDWTRDIAMHKSTIASPDAQGVVAGPGITQATLLSGFTLAGFPGIPATSAGTAALTLDGGSPTVRGNSIAGAVTGQGGTEANNRSIGIAIRATTDAAGAVIENNDITSGTAITSIGVSIESTGPTVTSKVTLANNVIRSGSARRSIGVYALRAAQGSSIANNDITSGNSTNGASVGLHVGSSLAVERNRINVDRTIVGTCMQAVTWCAGISVEGATTTLANNIVLAPRGQRTAGLLLAHVETAPGTVTVANNYFDGGGSGPAGNGSPRNTSAAIVLQSAGNTVAEVVTTVGRISNNILNGGINSDRYGIREEAGSNRQIHPVFVTANLFYFTDAFNRDDTIYREIGSSGIPFEYSSVFILENTPDPPAPVADNLEDNPRLDSTWHLGATSPCIDAGNATDAPMKDFEGDARPGGQFVDIGHDES